MSKLIYYLFFQKNWEKIGNLGEDKSEKADYNNFDFFSSFFDDLYVFYILPLVYLLVYSSLDTFFYRVIAKIIRGGKFPPPMSNELAKSPMSNRVKGALFYQHMCNFKSIEAFLWKWEHIENIVRNLSK